MSDVHTWDVLADNNTQAPPDGAPENILSSTLNNIMREYQAAIRRWQADNNGSLVSTGAANTYILASNTTYTSFFDGLTITFRPHQANTGSATVAVGGLAARTIRDRRNNTLTGGELQFNSPITLIYSTSTGNFHFSAPALPDVVPIDSRLSIEGTDVVDLANSIAPLRIGPALNNHMEIDAGLIQAKSGDIFTRPLGLNTLGGEVVVGSLADNINPITLRNAGTVVEGQTLNSLSVRNQAATANPIGGSHAVRIGFFSGGTAPSGNLLIGEVGFQDEALVINNRNHGGPMRLQGEDSGGTLVEMMRLNPAIAAGRLTNTQIRHVSSGLTDAGPALWLEDQRAATFTIGSNQACRVIRTIAGISITFPNNSNDPPVGSLGIIANDTFSSVILNAASGANLATTNGNTNSSLTMGGRAQVMWWKNSATVYWIFPLGGSLS